MKDVLTFESISSTNDFLKENYQNLNHLTIVTTDFQTSGRGQFLRVWESKEKQNLLFSVLFKKIKSEDVTLVQAIMIELIVSFFKMRHLNVYFKEPNDFYVGEQKIGGMLIETKLRDNNCLYLVIGIGFNINQNEFETLNATSFYLIKKRKMYLSIVKQQLFLKIRRTFREIKQYLLKIE